MNKLIVKNTYGETFEYDLSEIEVEYFEDELNQLGSGFDSEEILSDIDVKDGRDKCQVHYTLTIDEETLEVFDVGTALAVAKYTDKYYLEKHPSLLNFIYYRVLKHYWKQEEEEYCSRTRFTSSSNAVNLAMAITMLSGISDDEINIGAEHDIIYLMASGATGRLTRDDWKILWTWGIHISDDDDDAFTMYV